MTATDLVLPIVLLLAGIGIGVALGRALTGGRAAAAVSAAESDARAARDRADVLAEERDRAREQVDALQTLSSDAAADLARVQAALQHERESAQQRAADLSTAQEKLREQFEALAAKALHSNSEAVVQLAEQQLAKAQAQQKAELEKRSTQVENMVAPLRESLAKVDEHVRQLEEKRADAYSGLNAQVKAMAEAQAHLSKETSALVSALRRPQTRGQWGELQLRRAVEMAGMVEHCDFSEQVTIGSAGTQRPDMVIHLPEKRTIVVDSKVSLAAYLDAVETEDPSHHEDRMKAHARHLREHVDSLATKAYWEQFSSSPEFVVLFVPGESLLAPALERDPSLLDDAFAKRVMIVTPTVLIALLRTVAFLLAQAKVTENAIEVSALGRELYKRLGTMGGHLDKLGRSITSTVASYNKTIGSLERQVLVSARRMNDLGVTTDELAAPAPVDESVRPMTAAELIAWDEGAGTESAQVRALRPGDTAIG